jgi:hypothetical protein
MWSRHWLYAVPLVWCAAAVALVRPDAMVGRSDVPFAVRKLVYDESDLAALAVRGANAVLGRSPGRRDEPIEKPDFYLCLPKDLAAKLDAPQPPYSERFFLEYPTPALALFWAAFAVQPGKTDMPPAVADSQHFGAAHFVPRNEAERHLWARFHFAILFYLAVMTAALLGLIAVLARGYGAGGAVWLAVLPGAVFFSLNRFDVLPTLAAALSFAALSRGRRGWSGAWLGLAVVLKLYPVLFVPIVLRYLGVGRSVRWAVAFAAVVAAGFGASWAVYDWEATVGPIRVQLDRTYEAMSWTLYGRLLPESLAEWRLGRQAILVAAVLAAVAVRPADLAGVLRRCALVLIVFVSLAVFWSPQWIVWFLPLVVPLARRWWVIAPAVALDLLNYWSFPILFWIMPDTFDEATFDALAEATIYVRAAAWLGLAAGLVWDGRPADPAAAAERFRGGRDALLGAFLGAARATGLPRGLTWESVEPAGEPLLVRDQSGGLVALVPVVVRFEPVPGSEMEEVPQAREPRTVTALFTFERGAWQTVGRAVFNLSPAQVVEKRGGRYVPVTPRPTSR